MRWSTGATIISLSLMSIESQLDALLFNIQLAALANKHYSKSITLLIQKTHCNKFWNNVIFKGNGTTWYNLFSVGSNNGTLIRNTTFSLLICVCVVKSSYMCSLDWICRSLPIRNCLLLFSSTFDKINFGITRSFAITCSLLTIQYYSLFCLNVAACECPLSK